MIRYYEFPHIRGKPQGIREDRPGIHVRGEPVLSPAGRVLDKLYNVNPRNLDQPRSQPSDGGPRGRPADSPQEYRTSDVRTGNLAASRKPALNGYPSGNPGTRLVSGRGARTKPIQPALLPRGEPRAGSQLRERRYRETAF